MQQYKPDNSCFLVSSVIRNVSYHVNGYVWKQLFKSYSVQEPDCADVGIQKRLSQKERFRKMSVH